MELDIEVGLKLKKLREESKISSIREAARRIGIDHSYLTKIEKGKIPSLHKLKLICDFYGVPVSSLFGDEIETPAPLKEIGVEWIAFAKGMEKRKFTPEEIEKMVEVVQAFKKL